MLRFLTIPFNLLFGTIGLLFVSIFGNIKIEISHDHKIDIKRWTKSGKKKKNKTLQDDLDEERINLAHNNSIAIMKEVSEGTRTTNLRITLLLGYLSTIVATFAKMLAESVFSEDTAPYILVILMAYSILIFVVSYLLISPGLGTTIHSEPLETKYELKQNNAAMVKLIEIYVLADKIKASSNDKVRRERYLRNAIAATFIIPVATAGIFYYL